jgi:hypothetical protein
MRAAKPLISPAPTFALLLVIGCASINPRTSFDVTKSTDVGGLLLSSAVTVVAIGPTRSQLWDQPVESTTYDLTVPVSVQIACYGTTSGEWATRRASYRLRVTSDPDLRFRKLFLDEIYRYWRGQPPSYLTSYRYLPADKSVLEKNGRYVLYIKPGHEREGAVYLFHASNRVFELELTSVEGGGWGPLSSLIAEHVAFREDGEIVDQIYFEPKYPPARLIAQIESGALR